MEQSGQLSYFLFTFLPWDAPLGRRRLRGCSLWHRRFFRFCPGSDLESAHQKRQQGGEKPSPSRLRRATSPERERLWQRRKVYSLSADFFLSLTNEDETCPFCQGLSHSGERSPRATERVRTGIHPLRHGFAVPPLPKGRGFGKGGKFTAYRLTSSAVDK